MVFNRSMEKGKRPGKKLLLAPRLLGCDRGISNREVGGAFLVEIKRTLQLKGAIVEPTRS